jgi:hypothetical protein
MRAIPEEEARQYDLAKGRVMKEEKCSLKN